MSEISWEPHVAVLAPDCMATPAQINANRLNAQLSTGPASVEGKAATRFNAMKHGLDAASLVIPGEDPAEFDRLAEAFYFELAPVGPMEAAMVGAMIRAEWFRRRYAAIEASLWNTLLKNSDDPNATLGDAFFKDASGKNTLGKLHRRQQAVIREYIQASVLLRRLQEDRLAMVEAKPQPVQPAAVAAIPVPSTPAHKHPKPVPGQPWVGSEPPSWRL